MTDTFSNVEVDGKLTIPNGATVNNSGASLVLGGGSQTNIGTKTTTGGTLALGGQTLELNGAFLSNNGTISGGVVNINYGSTAKGAGNYAGRLLGELRRQDHLRQLARHPDVPVRGDMERRLRRSPFRSTTQQGRGRRWLGRQRRSTAPCR